MRETIEFTAKPRVNVSERRADFYRALPNRIEAGIVVVEEDEADVNGQVPTIFDLAIAVLAIVVLAVISTH